MRIISQTRISEFGQANPRAKKELNTWAKIALAGQWKTPVDVKAALGARVDWVQVSSGATVFVFDIANNNWRMIAAIHFVAKKPIAGRVYILRLLTHTEYGTNTWKRDL